MSDAHNVDIEKRLLAAALFELRVMLSGHLDPDDQSPASTAAWFAYALHNQALAALDGQPFDVARALEAVERLEPRLGERYLHNLRKTVLGEA
jgi:hypothetical protein